MKKIKVPDGMLAAAKESIESKSWDARNGEDQADCVTIVGDDAEALAVVALEAALLWLTENPIIPIGEKAMEIAKSQCDDRITGIGVFTGAVEWQRRMFLAPEPEYPDLIALANKLIDNPNWRSTDLYHILLKAFRMGEGVAIKTAVEGLRGALEPKTEPESKMGDS
jgi:hypothetical protein